MNGKLNLNMNKVKEARDYAQRIASEVHDFVEEHTTVSIERAICRFFGIDGVRKPSSSACGDLGSYSPS